MVINNNAQSAMFILIIIAVAAVAGFILISTQSGFQSAGDATTVSTTTTTTTVQCCQCTYSYRSSGVTLRTDYFSGKPCPNGDVSDCPVCLDDAEMAKRDSKNQLWRLIKPTACIAKSGSSCPDTTPPPVTTSDKKFCKCAYNCFTGIGSRQTLVGNYYTETSDCGKSGEKCTGCPDPLPPLATYTSGGQTYTNVNCELQKQTATTGSKYSGAACQQ